MVAFCDIRRGVYGFGYLLHGYREPLSDLWLTTNALSTVFNGLEIIGKSNIVFLTLIKFLDRNTYFLIDSQRRFDRLAGSTNAYIKNTRSLGVEVAGTANHFRATLAKFRYFLHSSATILKGLNRHYCFCRLDTLEPNVLSRPFCSPSYHCWWKLILLFPLSYKPS